MSDSEEDIFLTQSSFNGSINSGNDLENLLGDYENAQLSFEEATEGSTRRISMKKSQSAALTRRLKQMRRKRRRGISSS